MFKYFLSLISCVSTLAIAAEKKEEVVQCYPTTILKVETDEQGNQKVIVVHPMVIKCEPLKKEEERKPAERPPRLFPKQP